MGCDSVCYTDNVGKKEFQDLSKWKGATLEELRIKLKGQAFEEVRVYTVATTRLDKNPSLVVRHVGSGPNLEGGLATLCTCKHSMRQNHKTDDWKNKWILGLTSRAKKNGFNGEHYLFYLMKVEKAFESHATLFEYLKASNPTALQKKNAVNNRLGDIFEPKPSCISHHDPKMYKTPHNYHSHGKNGDTQWHHDIAYDSKPTPLLLGDVNNTFVWTNPLIKFKDKRGVGNMKLMLRDLLSELSI